MLEFKPTYLYIKQHSITGKLYFGKTIKNPEKYNGSGKHWIKHIDFHGKEFIDTIWYCLFYNKYDIEQFAISFSEQQNIVESAEWLNLIPENGINGGAFIHSKECCEKISKALKGRISPFKGCKFSVESKEKLSISMMGKSHPNSKETRLKISKALKGNPLSDEHKSALKVKHKPRTPVYHTEETKQKIREAALRRFAK